MRTERVFEIYVNAMVATWASKYIEDGPNI
jgi:hypothetical protein